MEFFFGAPLIVRRVGIMDPDASASETALVLVVIVVAVVDDIGDGLSYFAGTIGS